MDFLCPSFQPRASVRNLCHLRELSDARDCSLVATRAMEAHPDWYRRTGNANPISYLAPARCNDAICRNLWLLSIRGANDRRNVGVAIDQLTSVAVLSH